MSKIVQSGSYLTLHYRITIASGSAEGHVFIETFGAQPATLMVGSGQWSEGLERPLLGLEVGAERSYHVPAAQGFGEYNEDLLIYVSKAMLDAHAGEDEQFEADDMVSFTAPDGGQYSGVFKRWDGDKALFDFNHPLSGVDLRVDVQIIEVM